MSIEIPGPGDREQLMALVADAIGMRFGESMSISAPYRVGLFARDDGRAEGWGAERWQCVVAAVDLDEDMAPLGPPSRATVDLVDIGDGDYQVVNVNYGRLGEAIARAAAIAEEVTQGTNYLFSTVEVPELHFAAVQLVPTEEDADEIFIPLVPADLVSDEPIEDFELAPLDRDTLESILGQWADAPPPEDDDDGMEFGGGAASPVS